MDLTLFDSMSREKKPFTPAEGKQATLYTCGPTVYDYAHIGNFRAYIFEDLLHRTLKFAGYGVTQIMNLTDIDDKTIRNANEQGVSLDDYTREYKKAFFEDIKTLNISPCTAYPAATEHIPEMVSMIQTLLKKGHAYERDGSIYFSIASFKDYGKLAHLEQEDLLAGASGRVDADEYEKENVSDFVLWKKYTPKDGDVFWETELGKGRPGWHIECSAMSMKYLGKTMDLHTGGSDNLFPHHQNEIAQSEAATGQTFVRFWMHCAYLIVEGEKMSKTKGNFFTLRDLLDRGHSPQAIRYLLLTTHYRKLLNFSEAGVDAAASALHRINSFIQELLQFEQKGEEGRRAIGSEQMLHAFSRALADDLNISGALGALFSYIRKAREQFPLSPEEAEEALTALRRVDEILGVLNFTPATIDDAIETLIQTRLKARARKDFAESDRIRDELAAQGIILKDTPEGTVWEKRG